MLSLLFGVDVKIVDVRVSRKGAPGDGRGYEAREWPLLFLTDTGRDVIHLLLISPD